MQVVTLVPYVFHNNKRCEVGDLIEVSESVGMAMVMREEAVEIVDELPEKEKPKKGAKK